MKILTEGKVKARSMKELILQPQSELSLFRKFLREEGYHIVQENMIFEEGKYYPMMKVIPVSKEELESDIFEEQELWDAYGKLLLEKKNTVLQKYLNHRADYVETLLSNLKEHSADEQRVEELESESRLIKMAQRYM